MSGVVVYYWSLVMCRVQSPMIRREVCNTNRDMSADPSAFQQGLANPLGVSWPNGANATASLRDSSYAVDVDAELLTSPPPPPNVRTFTVPLFGRVQVITFR